jgi:carbon-monoxide dehydrogenase medium subunit
MKPAPFAYRDPRCLDDALELLAEHGDDATVLAGGQSLMPLLNLRAVTPQVIVDINRVPGLEAISPNDKEVVLGALSRLRSVERHPQVNLHLPVAVAALRWVAHPQIRNRATIGGNLAVADPASELPAVMAAFDGDVRMASKGGERDVSWEDFFVDAYTTARRPEEVIISARIPAARISDGTFVEIARRHGDRAIVGACVGLRLQDGTVAEARIAMSGVADVPVRLRSAEQLLANRPVDGAALADVFEAVRAALNPPSDVHATTEYRRHVAATIVCRALQRLCEGSRDGG